jgi:hypothetical protein
MKKYTKFGFLLGVIIILFVFLTPSAFGFSLSPSYIELEGSPGETIDVTFHLEPKGHEVEEVATFHSKIGGFEFDETGKKILLEDDRLSQEQWYSVSKWVTIDEDMLSTNKPEGVDFQGHINIPEDAEPGTYYAGAIFSYQKGVPETGATQFGFGGRIVSKLIINVRGEGEIEEELNLLSFEVDEEKYKIGNIEFVAKFENKSKFEIAPIGSINIYDENDQQVKQIIVETQKLPDGTTVLLDSKDEIIFNRTSQKVKPDSIQNIMTAWENRSIAPGKYTAKLGGYYGVKSTNIAAETSFEIHQSIQLVDFKVNSYFNGSLPVGFNAIVGNRGNVVASPTGMLEIKNMWGSTVFSQQIEAISLLTGQDHELNNLIWDNGFAMGTYTAVLTLTDSVSGASVSASAALIVISWWQIIIVLAILIIIIFAVYKSITGYRKMKKKVEQLEQ